MPPALKPTNPINHAITRITAITYNRFPIILFFSDYYYQRESLPYKGISQITVNRYIILRIYYIIHTYHLNGH